MTAKIFGMRCPHLDRLRSDLIEAYRRLEDNDLFVIANNPEAPDSQVYSIHQAIAHHRDICPICHSRSVPPDTASFLRQ